MLTSVRGEQMGELNVAYRQIDYFLVLMIYLDITLWIRIRFFVAAGPAFARIYRRFSNRDATSDSSRKTRSRFKAQVLFIYYLPAIYLQSS